MADRCVIDATFRHVEKHRWFCLVVAVYCCSVAGRQRVVADIGTAAKMPTINKFYDPSTFSNPDAWLTTYIKLRLDVDFTRHVLDGMVELHLQRILIDKNLILDAKDLTIKKIYLQNGVAVEHRTSQSRPGFGTALEIVLRSVLDAGTTNVVLNIEYSTSSNASGLVWMEPQQTAGGKHPYLYSYSQPIQSRAILPCQDTPSVKMPFDVEITVPQALVAVVSGLPKDHMPKNVSDTRHTFSYTMPHPVPVYLLAFAVGNIESRSIGPRSHVWSEPELVDRAAWEFNDTELMLKAAENICGPYVWQKYDILVLPPSFPLGGMENPCLTFATPTLLAGDRSLVNTIVHEMAHSWTGNLVTNSNWEHFWLNEGFTVFVERKIIALLNGGGEKGEKHRHFAAILGYRDLKDDIDLYGPTNPLTCLVPDLNHTHPDDSFSTVPYEKGHTFLFYLEQLVGASEFEEFLRAWVREYKYKTATSEDFQHYFMQYFSKLSNSTFSAAIKQIDWNAWFKQPGMPIVVPKYDTTLAQACTNLRQKWQTFDNTSEINDKTFPPAEFQTLSSKQKIEFLGQLLQTFDNLSPSINLDKLETMRHQYKELDVTQNSEIKFRWMRLQIKCKSETVIEPALHFAAVEQGRMKFSRPLFRDLYAWPRSRERALQSFTENRPRMGFVAANQIAKDLNLLPQTAATGIQA